MRSLNLLFDLPLEKALILALAAIVLYFILDFKKNIHKVLERHGDRIDESIDKFSKDVKHLRTSLTEHSYEIDKTQKKITGEFLKMQENIFRTKEELKEDFTETQLLFKDIKNELGSVNARIIAQNGTLNNYKLKVDKIEDGIKEHSGSFKEFKDGFDGFQNDFEKLRQMVEDNRDALLKSKEVLKVYSAEVKLLKKKYGAK